LNRHNRALNLQIGTCAFFFIARQKARSDSGIFSIVIGRAAGRRVLYRRGPFTSSVTIAHHYARARHLHQIRSSHPRILHISTGIIKHSLLKIIRYSNALKQWFPKGGSPTQIWARARSRGAGKTRRKICKT